MRKSTRPPHTCGTARIEPTVMAVLGLDIGGANIKAADAAGQARTESFEIWRAPDELADRLGKLLERFPKADRLAVTMTAELADCFETKAHGVGCIVRAVEQAAAGRPVLVWSTEGRFVSCAGALARPLDVAAANWHALAQWAGRLVPIGQAVLIDIGSTTTDIVPLCDGAPRPAGRTDVERLQSGELVYTGVRRTPLCAVAQQAMFRGRLCRVAAEVFATTLDVHVLRGRIAEDQFDVMTANGRPATVAAARDRLARMLCGDRDEISVAEISALAEFFAAAQLNTIRASIDGVLGRLKTVPGTVVVSGSGEFLAREVVAAHRELAAQRLISLSETLSSPIADAACAHAVAVLASEWRP